MADWLHTSQQTRKQSETYHTHTYTHSTLTHRHTQRHTYTHHTIHTLIQTYIHTPHMYTLSYTHTMQIHIQDTHTYAHILTHTYTRAHTYTHRDRLITQLGNKYSEHEPVGIHHSQARTLVLQIRKQRLGKSCDYVGPHSQQVDRQESELQAASSVSSSLSTIPEVCFKMDVVT